MPAWKSPAPSAAAASDAPKPASRRAVWFDAQSPQDTPIYQRDALRPGHIVTGPAIIEQLDATTVVAPGDVATVDAALNILNQGEPMSDSRSNAIDPITLEILYNGLRSITDETYIALMKSAYSTNIKERHDHSTAICDRRGRLVVQAENSLPIHLASMTGLMKCLLEKFSLDQIKAGDLFVANDPHVAGGTHLPRHQHGDAGVLWWQSSRLCRQHRAPR